MPSPNKLLPGAAHSSADAGFTLVELLIAFTVLGLIALMALGILQFGTRVWDRTVDSNESSDRIRAVQTLIRAQIGRVVERGRLRGVIGKTVVLQGTRDAIEFVAPLPTSRDTGEFLRQRLAVKTDTDGGSLVLTWQQLENNEDDNVLFETSTDTSAVLLTHVSSLEYAYLARGRGGKAPSWQDAWDRKEPPLLVRLRIVFEPDAKNDWPELLVAPRPIVP